MATQRITFFAAMLVVLAVTASASRGTGVAMGRELKQVTPLPTVAALPTLPAAGGLPPAATIPTLPAGTSTDPFMSALSRMVSFLQDDAASLQSAINGAAEGVNNTVSSIPLVQTFETQLATALQELQTVISGIVSQGAALGGTAQTNLDSFLTDLTSRDPITAILQNAMGALPPTTAGR